MRTFQQQLSKRDFVPTCSVDANVNKRPKLKAQEERRDDSFLVLVESSQTNTHHTLWCNTCVHRFKSSTRSLPIVFIIWMAGPGPNKKRAARHEGTGSRRRLALLLRYSTAGTFVLVVVFSSYRGRHEHWRAQYAGGPSGKLLGRQQH